MRVAFLGLGVMGYPMAGHLKRAGHNLVVYNRTRAKCADLEKAGAKVAGSMVEACRGRDVVISMVTDDKALVEVVNEGVVPGLPKGSIHIEACWIDGKPYTDFDAQGLTVKLPASGERHRVAGRQRGRAPSPLRRHRGPGT